MDTKHRKEVKRKRIKEGRIRCHGNVFSCTKIGGHLWIEKQRKWFAERREQVKAQREKIDQMTRNTSDPKLFDRIKRLKNKLMGKKDAHTK